MARAGSRKRNLPHLGFPLPEVIAMPTDAKTWTQDAAASADAEGGWLHRRFALHLRVLAHVFVVELAKLVAHIAAANFLVRGGGGFKSEVQHLQTP